MSAAVIYLLGSLIFALVLLLCLRRMRKLDERDEVLRGFRGFPEIQPSEPWPKGDEQ